MMMFTYTRLDIKGIQQMEVRYEQKNPVIKNSNRFPDDVGTHVS